MDEALRFVGEHGYAVLFAWVWLEQFGVPIPGEPLLIAAGALAGAGHLRFAAVLGVAAAASLLADLGWYVIGRRWGSPALRLLCRFVPEPDTCVRHTKDLLMTFGGLALVMAKFIPGLNTLAQPVAGAIAMPFGRFVVFETIGTVVWLGTFIGLGYVFSSELIWIVAYARGLGIGILIALGGGLAVYVAWKLVRRRQSRGQLTLNVSAGSHPPLGVRLAGRPPCGGGCASRAAGQTSQRVERKELAMSARVAARAPLTPNHKEST